MSLWASVVAKSEKEETQIIELINIQLRLQKINIEIKASTHTAPLVAPLVFLNHDCIEKCEEIKKTGRSVILVVPETWEIQKLPVSADDLLVMPFRGLEVANKFKLHEQFALWNDVHALNMGFREILDSLSEDLQMIEKMQKAHLPVRFPDIKGLSIRSRYFAGMKSGGDHFDVSESKDENQISIMVSDSSSYGLSSAILGSFMKIAVQLSRDTNRSSIDTVKLIHQEVKLTLKDRDQLSLFYGMIDRKTLKLRYVHSGQISFFRAHKASTFEHLEKTCEAITSRTHPDQHLKEASLILNPGDRIVIMSDGFTSLVEDQDSLLKVLNEKRKQEAEDTLNEFSFLLKKGLKVERLRQRDDELLPEQDCTCMIIDVDDRVLRLAH